MSAADVLAVAIPFVWFGMVVAISFIETPLKFRAPGVTIPVGLGIGRIVFSALGRVEMALLVALTAAVALSNTRGWSPAVILAALWLIMLLQVLAVRPRLARRSDAVIAGDEVPASRLHIVFIVLDVVKIVALFTLATLLLVRIQR